MDKLVIYHNPRCSKSRETLQLLRDRGLEPEVVEYLRSPPDVATLRRLSRQLGMEPADLLRTKEPLYAELGLAEKTLGPGGGAAALRAMAEHPILIERPIVVRGERARLGRPPERVLEIMG